MTDVDAPWEPRRTWPADLLLEAVDGPAGEGSPPGRRGRS
jgi:hypothetical protein